MRTIQKGREPRSLTQHRMQTDASYDNYADKDALRQALVTEQYGLCCYCQSRIRATSDGMKIEHWQCQSNYPERQLDFSNMHGVCKGNEGQSIKNQHCDTRKGNNDLCFSVCDPSHPIEIRIKFWGDGTIKADNADIDHAINDVLNLNQEILVANRKAVLEAFRQRLQRGSRINPVRELPNWDGSQPGELPEFAQVIVYWLRKRQARATS